MYLNDILSQFPNLENEDEVLAFLSITDKEHTNKAILKIEEKLAKLGVTQLFGEFTLQSESNVCDAVSYVSKIFYQPSAAKLRPSGRRYEAQTATPF